jgi:biopolymer transport protein ExbB
MLPLLFAKGGPMIWLLLLASAAGLAVFIERLLFYHRAQINSAEFLNGVRTVLRRRNIVEALSICEATPGPVARLVKAAVLAREQGREGVREAVEQAGAVEVPRLEEKLAVLATLAQVAPLLGLLGSLLGFIRVFRTISAEGQFATLQQLAGGIWESLFATAAGVMVAIPAYIAYNFLVTRMRSIVSDMEKSSAEIVKMVAEPQPAHPAHPPSAS